MPELAPQERLQPSLLDRLTDLAPDEKQESRNARVLSIKQLRECVLRDLGWLLNTDALGAILDLDDYPQVQRSTINFGMPELSGRLASSVDVAGVERAVRQAILDFEPRLIADSVEVRAALDSEKMSHNVLTLEIEAQLWAQPLPLQLLLRTDVDLEAGAVNISERSAR